MQFQLTDVSEEKITVNRPTLHKTGTHAITNCRQNSLHEVILPDFAACILSCMTLCNSLACTIFLLLFHAQQNVPKLQSARTSAQAQNTNFQSKFECNVHPTSNLLEVISTVKCIAKENVVPDEHSFPGQQNKL